MTDFRGAICDSSGIGCQSFYDSDCDHSAERLMKTPRVLGSTAN